MTEQNAIRARKYARLVAQAGIAITKGMCIDIRIEPELIETGRIFAEECYKLGAKFVNFDLRDLRLQRARIDTQSKEELAFYPAFLKSYDKERVKDSWGLISFDATEGRAWLDECDKDKNTYFTSTWRKNGKILHDACGRHSVPWCVICAPGMAWAKETLGEGASEDDMWDAIAPILHLDNPDPAKTWFALCRKMQEQREKLNKMQIKTLHYLGQGADLTIALGQDAVWKGGSQTLPDGRVFIPNLPTYEVYTAPDCLSAEGFITTTRPVQVLGQKVVGAKLTFKGGKCVRCKAKEGEETLRRYLKIDKGTSRIGEVALVDTTSPVSQSGLVFGSILYDENASCHLALGSSYPDCVKGAENARDSELIRYGLNKSTMHTDFMVGSPNVDITATLYSGKTATIIESGKFVI